MQTTYPLSQSISTQQITRQLERRDRRDKLIHHLRSAAYFASLASYNTVGLADRCRLARLVGEIDQTLRRLVNEPPEVPHV